MRKGKSSQCVKVAPQKKKTIKVYLLDDPAIKKYQMTKLKIHFEHSKSETI